jgi:hypothetical protein
MHDLYGQRILIITVVGLVALSLLFAALQAGLL